MKSGKLAELANHMGWNEQDIADFVKEIAIAQNVKFETQDSKRPTLENRIANALKDMGLHASFRGFQYSCEAVKQVALNPDMLHRVMDGLFVQIANMYDTTPSGVERGIRYAVEKIWELGDTEIIKYYLGNSISMDKDKPTCKQFVATLAEFFRQENIK